MNIYQYFVIAILTAICAVMLKKRNAEISLLLSIAGVVVIFLAGANYISSSIEQIRALNVLEEEFFEIPLKLLGLSILSKITCSICEDFGEKGLASATSVITRFASITIAFPLFEKLLEQIKVALLI